MAPPRIHGHRSNGQNSRTYQSWFHMKDRCLNPKTEFYYLYGGRGIRVAKEWLSFENFLRDMGERPAGLSLERIDNNGNYEPGNCRWATPKDQALNRRNASTNRKRKRRSGATKRPKQQEPRWGSPEAEGCSDPCQ